MKPCLFPFAVAGLLAILTLLAGNSEHDALAQEGPVKKTVWSLKEFGDAGSLICAWEKGKAEEVAKVCEDLGFEIVDVAAMRLGVVCEWKGKLDQKKLEALQSHENVRYVEPNLTCYATPRFSPADVNQTVEFKPVFTPDNVLEELKKSKQMICAWRPGTKKEDVAKACEALGFEIVDINEGVTKYVVCTWKGELKQETINKLAADPSVLYIEPNLEVGIGGVELGKEPKQALADPKKPFAVLPQDEFISQLYARRGGTHVRSAGGSASSHPSGGRTPVSRRRCSALVASTQRRGRSYALLR